MIKSTVKKNQENLSQHYEHKPNFDYQVGTGYNEHEPRVVRIPDKVSPDCGWEVPEHCLVTRFDRSGEGKYDSRIHFKVSLL